MIRLPAHAIRLLIVDRSLVVRERLCRLFDDAPDIDVVGEAGTSEKALRLLEETSPTAVLMDCDLPKPGSFATVEEMMCLYRVPIIMVTKQGKAAVPALEVRALETGAVALVPWAPNDSPAAKAADANLVRVVRAMSEVKVVRRREHSPKMETAGRQALSASPRPPLDGAIDIVAIGASTGGPPVIQTILRGLSRPLPVPILVVQHITPGFQQSLVKWLADSTGARIWLGEHGMPLSPGIVYLAPDDRHMMVDASGRLILADDPPENGSRPSVSVLFRSVALRYGPRAIGILLTGMGRDGAKELRLMRDRGAVTIAQDEGTSVVHGMPGEAIKLKGARYILAPDRVASVIEHHLGGSAHARRELGTLPLSARWR